MKRMALCLAALLAASLPLTGALADDLPKVRLGLLKFGTVNWEADTLKQAGLDKQNGFELEIVPFAGGDATRIALLSGNIDVTTGDWLFASRQRGEGVPFTFVPYSTSIGAIMAPCDAGWHSLDDLKGKTIGVAGGPLDKSWLMFRGMAQGVNGFDLVAETEQVFGAPPLLAEKLRQGELDAALNYWHYNARLETEGFCEVVSAQAAAEALGATHPLSAVGFIFSDEWADANPGLAMGFVKASREAKALLAKDDAAWEGVRDSMNAENDAVFKTLIARWREGIPSEDVAAEEADTAKVYDYLAEVGGEELVGSAITMAPGTFWTGLTAPAN